MVPSDRRYVESHEWAKKDGNVVTVGITAFAVEHLSDLTFLSLPAVGTKLKKGDRFGEIESVKAVSELFAPVGGEVVEVNERLTDAPELVNTDPYGDGWMVRIRIADPSEVDELLMTAEEYDEYVETESH